MKNEKLRHQLSHSLTSYDASQRGKKSYNPHALPIYLERVDAIMAGLSGTLQKRCLKAAGLAASDGDVPGGAWFYQPVKLPT